jgi:pyruvate/2-oxoglutarate dehydrogenase complex dihydrolipoamide acyltransferase (E2) component
MSSNRTRPRLIVLAGGTVLVVLGAVIAGCGNGGNQAPSTPTTTTTTTTTSSPSSTAAPAPAPTEKSINPTGGNLFTPGVKAPPAQTVPPGQHPGINGVP